MAVSQSPQVKCRTCNEVATYPDLDPQLLVPVITTSDTSGTHSSVKSCAHDGGTLDGVVALPVSSRHFKTDVSRHQGPRPDDPKKPPSRTPARVPCLKVKVLGVFYQLEGSSGKFLSSRYNFENACGH